MNISRKDVILVSYSGNPIIPDSLTLDNSLARLSGYLKYKGRSSLILDYSTIDTIEKFFPHHLRPKLEKIVENLTKYFEKNESKYNNELKEYYKLEKEFKDHNKFVIKEISKEIIYHIKKNKPKLIGFKLWMGDSYNDTIEIAKIIKRKFPDLVIIAGGPQVTWFKKEIAREVNVFDYLVSGEGERVLYEILNSVDKKRDLFKFDDKTVVRNEIIDDFNSIPFDNYDEDTYLSKRDDNLFNIILLSNSLGCANHCSFCAQSWMSQRKLKKRTIERSVEEIEFYKSKYGISIFRDASSNPPRIHRRDIAKRLIEKDVKALFASFGHISASKAEDFEILYKAGYRSIFFGVESGDDFILKKMNKRTNRKRIYEILTASKEAGIVNVAGMIIPAPFETKESMENSLKMCIDLKPIVIPSIPIVGPHSDWVENPVEYNIELLDPDNIKKVLKNNSKYLKFMMNYRAKFSLPTFLQTPFPNRINNKDFYQYSHENQHFVEQLKKNGVTTHMTDLTVLIAQVIGDKNYKKIKDLYRALNFGDFAKLREYAKEFNQKAKYFTENGHLQ